MRQFTKLVLAMLMVLGMLVVPNTVFAVSDDEFRANESYYKNLCFGVISKDNQAVCSDFQDYIDRKVEGQKADIADLELEIDEIQANITKYASEIRTMEAAIVEMEEEIAANEVEVERMQTNIETLESQIIERQKEIDRLDLMIKDRMAAMQTSMRTKNEISFLFGATDFADFIRRSAVINTITEFDQEQIDLVTQMRQQLKDEQEEVIRQQDLLRVTIANTEIQKEAVEATKRNVEIIVAEYKKQEEELLAKQSEQEENIRVTQESRNAIKRGLDDLAFRLEQERLAALNEGKDTSNIGVGKGWINPVQGSFYVSAGTWAYPSGGTHLGVDLAGAAGKPVVSTGPGVVLIANNSCPAYGGYLGNWCGYPSGGGGNQVYTVIQMEDGLYGMKYLHLQAATVSAGTIIGKGSVLGYVGHSGNSSGPHLHHEVFYLGDYDLSTYVNDIWSGSHTFTPNGARMNLSWRCEVKSGAPCLVNAQTHYGYSVGAWY